MSGPNPGNAQIAAQWEPIPGIPPNAEDITVYHGFTGEDMSNESPPIEDDTITAGNQKGDLLPAKIDTVGTVNVSLDAVGHRVQLASFQRNVDTTEPEAGVFEHVMGPLRATPVPISFVQVIGRDDQMAEAFVGSETQAITITATEGAAVKANFGIVSFLGTYWDNANPVLSNPHTGILNVRGNPLLWNELERPDGDLRILLSDYSDESSPKVKVMRGPLFLTGTMGTGVATPNVVGVGTRFLAEAQAGESFSLGGLIVEVLSVEDDTHMTLTAPETAAGVTATRLYGDTESSITPGVDAKGRPAWSELFYALDGSRVGNREQAMEVRAYLGDAGLAGGTFDTTTPATVALTGTVEATGMAVTGTGTFFLSEVEVGSAIRISGEYRRVVDVLSDTSLTLNADHPGTLGPVPATTDVEWTVARERGPWVEALPDVGIFNELHLNFEVDGEEFCASEIVITGERPLQRDPCLGNRVPKELDGSGQRDIKVTFTRRYKDTTFRRFTESGKRFAVTLEMRTPLEIALPSLVEYGAKFIMPKCLSIARTAVVENGQEIGETIECLCRPDLEAAYPDDLTVILWNDIADILAA